MTNVANEAEKKVRQALRLTLPWIMVTAVLAIMDLKSSFQRHASTAEMISHPAVGFSTPTVPLPPEYVTVVHSFVASENIPALGRARTFLDRVIGFVPYRISSLYLDTRAEYELYPPSLSAMILVRIAVLCRAIPDLIKPSKCVAT